MFLIAFLLLINAALSSNLYIKSTQDYSEDISNNLRLTYRVEQDDASKTSQLDFFMTANVPIVNFDSIKGIESIYCQDSSIYVKVVKRRSVRNILKWKRLIFPDGILAMIHPEHNCNDQRTVQWKLIQDIQEYDDLVLVLSTTEADLTRLGGEYEFKLGTDPVQLYKRQTPTTQEIRPTLASYPIEDWDGEWSADPTTETTVEEIHQEISSQSADNSTRRRRWSFPSLRRNRQPKKHFNWTSNQMFFPLGTDYLTIQCIDCYAVGYFSPIVYIRGLFKSIRNPRVDLEYVGELDSNIKLRFNTPFLPPMGFEMNLLNIPIHGFYIPGLLHVGPAFKIKAKFRIFLGPRAVFSTGFKLKIPPFKTFFKHKNNAHNVSTPSFRPKFKFIPIQVHSKSLEARLSFSILPEFTLGLTLFGHINLDVGVGYLFITTLAADLVQTESCNGTRLSGTRLSSFVATVGPSIITLRNVTDKLLFEKCHQL